MSRTPGTPDSNNLVENGRSATLAAALSSGALIAQHVAGKATRDALFLSNFDLSMLPVAMAAAAAVSTLAVLGVARAITLYSPARVVPVIFGSSALLFFAEWALSLRDARIAALAVYFHMAIFAATAVSAFWSLVNERFNPHEAKRLVGRIASGGTLGGVLGGLLAWRSAGVLSVSTMLALLGGINLLALVGVQGLLPPRPTPLSAKRETTPPGNAAGRADARPSGLRVIREVPYLRNLAAVVLLGAIMQALLDYTLSAHAQAAYGKGEALLAFFALFHMLVGVVAFLAQTTLSGIALERLGLAWSVAMVSAVVVLGASGATLVRTFASIVVARASEAVVRNSVYRAAYELLFTPLPPDRKRPTKTLIDVGFDRIGTAVGSVIVMGTAALAAANVDRVLLGASVAFSVASFFFALRLHRGYVSSLAESLLSGSLQLDVNDVVDLTTRHTLAETTMALDRGKLLESIAELQKNRAQAPTAILKLPALFAPATLASDDAPKTEVDTVLEAIRALRSGDPALVRGVFSREEKLESALIPHAIALLKTDALARDALRALRRVAPRATGQLVDALLRDDEDVEVRRRVPRVLKVCATGRAVDGLMMALADPSFEVRQQCALALRGITGEHPALAPSRDAVLAIVQRELTLGNASWETAAGKSDVPRGLQHLVTLLGLVFEREPLEIAFRALSAADGGLRGTALEYLEVVLPPGLRSLLWPLVDGETAIARHAPARSRNEIEGELLRSGTVQAVRAREKS